MQPALWLEAAGNITDQVFYSKMIWHEKSLDEYRSHEHLCLSIA